MEKKYSAIRCILLNVIIIFCSSALFGQNNSLYIHTSQNDEIISIKRNFKFSSQQEIGNINWNIDRDSISILFDSSAISNPLSLSDFNFNLESIEDIESIKCNLIGYSSEEGQIQDLKIYLSDGENYISSNQANRNLKGKRWPDILDDWTYYFDLEKDNFTPLSGNKLSLILQIENSSDSPVKAVIHDVEIKITYQPRFKVCKDEVVTFFVDEPGAGYNYNWSLPTNTLLVSEENNSNIINVLFQNNDFREKSLSVEATKGSEKISGQRYINYYDCSLSEIIGNFWIDKNCNSEFDSLEIGLDSISLGLFEYDILISNRMTDSLGYFNFDSISSSIYDIRFELKNEYLIQSNDGVYFYGLINEDNRFKSNYFELKPGIIFDSLSFGVVESSNLSGFIWEDINGDNFKDTSETFTYPNMRVRLESEFGFQKADTTDGNGNYYFNNIPSGDYEICPEFPNDIYISGKVEDINCTSITILCGDKSKVSNIGLIEKGQISGIIWVDENENGIRNSNEEILSDLEVFLLDTSENIIDSIITDSLGFYLFNNITLGSYKIVVNVPNHYNIADFQVGAIEYNNDFKIIGENATSNVIDITSGMNFSNIDCGLVIKKCSLGDFVWLDSNENGFQDENEKGINDIIIQLYDENGIKILETQSENSFDQKPGYYKFENINSGNYYIKAVIPDLFVFTDFSQLNQSINSDIQNETGKSKVLEILPGNYLNDIDVGLIYNYGSIESFVWLDENENGIQDSDEKGLNDIKLSLYNENDESFGIQYSNGAVADGICLFKKLIPGKYYLKLEDLSNEFLVSKFQEGIDPDVDSDFNIDNLKSIVFDILPGSKNANVDLGLKTYYSSIEGIVWNDKNQDGIINIDEERLDGIQIELYNETADQIAITSTGLFGQKGKYKFDKISKANYFVKFIITQDYLYSEGIGSDMDIKGTFGEGTTDLIIVDWGDSVENIDGGLLIKNGRIGDFVWIDENENGIQDIGEEGVAGINVQLMDIDGNIVEKTFTDFNGNYSFGDIFPKKYSLLFINDGRFEFTQTVLNNELGSKVMVQTGDGYTNVFDLLPNEDKNDMDAGLIFKFASIGDKVWIDSNSNGIFDSSENGLGGVNLSLYNENDSLISETISDIDGNYFFKNILQGEYYIKINVPDTLNPPFNNGSIYQLSNQNGQNTTSVFILEAGLDIVDADFGLLFKKATISDLVWFDENENGLQDLGEKGINGIEIRLYDSNSTYINETISKRIFGVDGYYEFEVDPGKYYLEFDVKDIYKTTFGLIGVNKNLDSDITNVNGNGTTDLISVNSGQLRIDIDAGFNINKSQVGGKVWFDENGDGIFNETEPGIDGIKIKLYSLNNALIDSTISESLNGTKGNYVFENLFPGEYYLVFESPEGHIPTVMNNGNDDLDSDIVGINGEGSTDWFSLAPGESVSNNYGGFVLIPKNVIGDLVWLDFNLNGVQDNDEYGIDEIVVKLYNKDGIEVRSTVTSKNIQTGKSGFYKFTNVPEGEYYVQFVIPIGYLFTKSGMGDNDSLDNDVISVYGNTRIFSVNENSEILNIDAGLKYDRNSGIGDFVWEDMNGNGLQDIDELGINGVTIRLYKEGKGFIKSTVSITHTKTGKKGYYLFENLSSGRYYIKVDLPDNYYFTKPMSNQFSDKNSDINDGNGFYTSNFITLGVNDRHYDIDIGMYQFGSVGNKIWNDLNKNGIQNKFEYGVDDVHLSIHEKDADNELLSTTSDFNGHYSFNNLLPGLYYIKVHNYNKELFTIPSIGGSRNDSDITHDFGVGTTSLFQIISGIEKEDIDIGIVDDFNIKLNTYPNPVKDVLLLSYFGKKSENAKVIIFDTDGNKIIESNFNSTEGENIKELNIKDLKFGFYNIVLVVDGNIADNDIILKVDSK